MKHLVFALAASLLLSTAAAEATTIAWDGKTLACDSQCTLGSMKLHVNDKITYIPEQKAYIGAAGDVAAAADFKKVYAKTGIVTLSMLVGLQVLIINRYGKCFYYEEGSADPSIIVGPMAIGSGMKFALVAMDTGKTAAEAVAEAERWDLYTSGEIHTLTPESLTAQKP